MGELLEHHCFAGLRRRHDEAARAPADGRHQIEYAHGIVVWSSLQQEALLRKDRHEFIETQDVADLLRCLSVDVFNLQKSELVFSIFRRPYRARDEMAC